jgi:Cu(I)/Ag(I) efflux system membrane fusion protein
MSDVIETADKGPPPGVRGMAVLRWLLILAMAGAALASVLHYTGALERLGSRPTASAAHTEYTCPMHPSVAQDHPGECPICSMTLVPKAGGPAGAAADAATDVAPVAGLHDIELAPARTQLMGLRTATATREALVQEIRTVGSVVENEQGLAQIQTRFAGWIQELHVTTTGQVVHPGDVLATVYSPDVLAAQEEYLNALKWADGGAPNPGLADDARQRLALLGIAKPELDQIARSRAPLRAIPIRSTIGGTVIRRTAVQGLYVQPGQDLFDIADLAKVWVLADVYEYELARVHVGLPAKVEVAAFPGETREGKVTFLYPTLDAATRTLRVRIELANRDGKLRPGMYGTVILALDAAEGVVVPREAVVDTGEVRYVFVAQDGGRFEPRRVTLGVHGDDKIQVVAGLAPGERVVTSGNFLVDSESRLRAAVAGETAEGTPAPAPAAPAGRGEGPVCATDFDAQKYPDKAARCRQCEIVHRGMGSMEEDCKTSIPKPWK